MDHASIDKRYSDLAESSCCLSCGGAIQHAGARKGETCLDLGSGRGTDALRLAEQVGPGGFVYGQDIAAGMLAKARQTARSLAVTHVDFLESPIESIPLPDRKVDLVVSNCTINHARDKVAVWSEIFRVLKQGGRFVVSDIYSSEPVPPEYASDPDAIAECWAGSVTREAYLSTLAACGFKNIRVLEESAPYPKGKITVSSITLYGERPAGCGCQGSRGPNACEA